MKLSTALTKLKNLKSQLGRTDNYVLESVTYYEGDVPEYDFLEESENRRNLLSEIRGLKTKIMQTNAVTKVSVTDTTSVTLNELILLNAELRSELAHWTKLLAIKVEDNHIYSGRTKDTVKKVYAKNYSKQEIKSKLIQLEKSKEQIEGLLAQANSQTDLIG